MINRIVEVHPEFPPADQIILQLVRIADRVLRASRSDEAVIPAQERQAPCFTPVRSVLFVNVSFLAAELFEVGIKAQPGILAATE